MFYKQAEPESDLTRAEDQTYPFSLAIISPRAFFNAGGIQEQQETEFVDTAMRE